MKFLTKSPESPILKQAMTYRRGDNTQLRQALLEEQKNFCAYTEKYIASLDSIEIEHFNSSLKYQDDYYNYYAVLRAANLYKKDEQYRGSSFFDSLFFQKDFGSRIRFLREELVYEEINADDSEAIDFIDFIGLNHNDVFEERRKHIERLKFLFSEIHDKHSYFRDYREELKFITAIEAEFEIDLSEFYK